MAKTALPSPRRSAYRERAGGVFGVKGSSLFAPLRGHPRFQALLRQMHLA